MKQWFLIETKAEYQKATERYEEIKEAKKGSEEHKEKMLLILLVNQYITLQQRCAHYFRFIFRHDGANKNINVWNDRKFHGLSEYIIIF